MADSLRGLPLFEIFASIWEAPLGRTEAVRRAFERLEQIDALMVPGAPMLGWPCARAGLTDYAESFFQRSLTIPKTIELWFAPGGFGLMGPICWMEGQLAQMTGRSELALQHFAKAAQLARSLKSPPLVAQIELSWAEALAAQDPQAAAEHAQLALSAAQSVGLEVTAKRAARLLEVHTAKEVPSAGAVRQVSLLREGDVWLLQTDHIKLRLSHSKGLAYLETLLLAPHRPVHALELAGVDEQSDGGPMLDEQARRAYRARAATLQQELEEATAFNDLGRSERLLRELDAIGDELSRAFGISGRARSHGSAAERARINVQRRLRDVIKRVTEQDKVLGRHLELSIKTGNFCMYAPTWPA
jgi:non-specific serine/threonine protein kinase